MAKYRYTGEVEVYFASLGLTLNEGDEFEGPEGLTNYGLVLITESSKKAKSSDQSSTNSTESDPETTGSEEA